MSPNQGLRIRTFSQLLTILQSVQDFISLGVPACIGNHSNHINYFRTYYPQLQLLVVPDWSNALDGVNAGACGALGRAGRGTQVGLRIGRLHCHRAVVLWNHVRLSVPYLLSALNTGLCVGAVAASVDVLYGMGPESDVTGAKDVAFLLPAAPFPTNVVMPRHTIPTTVPLRTFSLFALAGRWCGLKIVGPVLGQFQYGFSFTSNRTQLSDAVINAINVFVADSISSGAFQEYAATVFSYDRPQCVLEDFVEYSEDVVGWSAVTVKTISGECEPGLQLLSWNETTADRSCAER